MLKKSIALALFYRDCGLAYFRSKTPWTVAKMRDFVTRMFYYSCNWCYGLFLNFFEAVGMASQPLLVQIDKALQHTYFYPSQFWIALQEGIKIEPEKLYRLTYGETSWLGIARVLKAVGAKSDDVFFDLGCGTGRNVFYAHAVYGMKAVGIDLIPTFVRQGNHIAQTCGLSDVQFIQTNAFHYNIQQASIVYVTANCYDQECMDLLIKRLQDLKAGARVISTARPIPSPELIMTGYERLFFTWGMDKVYYHEKRLPGKEPDCA